MKTTLALGLASAFLLLIQADKDNLLGPTNKKASWRFEQVEGGKGTITETDEAIEFEVTAVDGTDWHVQAVQTNLDLKEGKEYTLKFQAKASEPRSIGINAMIDQEDWHQIGLSEEIYLTKEYKEFSSQFQVSGSVPKKNRISVVMGLEKGKVWIKNMTLVEKK